jgi:hypothetical protein
MGGVIFLTAAIKKSSRKKNKAGKKNKFLSFLRF